MTEVDPQLFKINDGALDGVFAKPMQIPTLQKRTLQVKLSELFAYVEAVEDNTFDMSQAASVAALALSIQFDLIDKEIPPLEKLSRQSKNEIKYASADAFKKYKLAPKVDGAKITDAAVTHLINGDEKVKEADEANIDAEVEAKKLNAILASVKDAHIMFRGMSRS